MFQSWHCPKSKIPQSYPKIVKDYGSASAFYINVSGFLIGPIYFHASSIAFYCLISQRHEEDDVSDWEEGDATDEALEVPRRVPFPEFGGDIVHNTGK